MPDREKVIKALECCPVEECRECPYVDGVYCNAIPKKGKSMVEIPSGLMEEALELLKAQEAPDNVGWISVEDRLPEEEKLYLVFREEQPRMMVLEYNTEKKEFGWTDYPTCRWNKREGVTHWMPLPEPPKGDEHGSD